MAGLFKMVIEKIKELMQLIKEARKLKIPDHELWTLEYLSNDETVYIGWMRGYKSDMDKLRKLGVEGPMTWKPSLEYGIIERCIITKEIAQELKKYSGFLDGSTFTGIDKDGNQISFGGEDFD